jgi:hypothetical protein
VCFSPGRDSERICIYADMGLIPRQPVYSTLPPPGKAFTSPPPPIVSESGRRKEILNSLVRKVFYDKGCPSAFLYICTELDRKVVLPVFLIFLCSHPSKILLTELKGILRFRARSFIYVEELSALSSFQYNLSLL